MANNNYNYNSSYSAELNNNKTPQASLNPTIPSGGYNYKPTSNEKKRRPAWIVNNDPEFLTAQEVWGVYAGELMNACKRMPVAQVRRSIQYVAMMGNARFKPQYGPIEQQRGRYLKTILDNGGIFDYYRQESQAGDLR